MNCELKDEIKLQNTKLRRSLTQGTTTDGRGPDEMLVKIYVIKPKSLKSGFKI